MKRKLLLSSAVIPALLASGAAAQVVNFHDSNNGFPLTSAVGLTGGSYCELFAGQGAYSDPGNDIWNGFGFENGYNSTYYFTAAGGNWPYQPGNPGNPYAAFNSVGGWTTSTGDTLFNLTAFGSGSPTNNGDADSSGQITPITLKVGGYQGDYGNPAGHGLTLPNGTPSFLLLNSATNVGAGSSEVFTLQNVPSGTYGLYLYGANYNNNRGTLFSVNSGNAHNGIAATLNSGLGAPAVSFVEG